MSSVLSACPRRVLIASAVMGLSMMSCAATGTTPSDGADSHLLQACMAQEVPAALQRVGVDPRIRTREDAAAMAHFLCQHAVRSCAEAPAADACRLARAKYGLSDAQPVSTLGQELFDAAFRGDTAGVQRKLAEKADVDWRNVGGWTPVMIASAERHLGAVELLLAAGANPNLRNHYGRTALMFAAGYGQTAIVDRLLAAGADPNLVPTDASGWTALLAACARGHVDTVATLLRAKADITQRARDGKTALDLARDGGHRAVQELLRSAGAEGS